MMKYILLKRLHDFKGIRLFVACLLGLIGTYFSKDPGLFLLGAALLILFTYLFFNKTLPPILLFCFIFQWFFFQGQLLDALLKDQSITALDYISETRPEVIQLGFIGTFFFFAGIYLVVRKVRIVSLADFKSFFLSVRLTRLLKIYLLVYVVLFVFGKFIWLFPGLSQPLYAFTLFRWVVFFLLFNTIFFQNKFKGVLLLLIIVDSVLGFVSFFSHFKEVIYFSFVAYWIFFFRSSMMAQLSVIVIFGLTIYLGAYWTAMKEDYRYFLNQGSGAQTVRVSRSEAYSKLLQLAGRVEDKDLSRGFDDLVTRLSWIGAFDAVYNRVPRQIPHEEGALWWDGITRPFLPRIFFPDKLALTDSKELNHYSALDVDEKNTSVSLSMIAGSYVDFGKWGMHVPLFLFGLFCGWIYLTAVRWGRYTPIGFALTMPMILLLQISEQSINRIISSIVLYFLVLWFVQKFLLRPFTNYILK